MNTLEKLVWLEAKLGVKYVRLSIKGLMFSKRMLRDEAIAYLYQQHNSQQQEQTLQKVG